MSKNKKGRTLHSSAREIIYNIIQFCHRERSSDTLLIDLEKVTERVAAMTGVSRKTVSKIKKEGATNNGAWCTPGEKRKGRPKKIVLGDFDRCVIRNKIHEFYTVRKEPPTLRKLHCVLKEVINFGGGISTLREILKEMGYEYKKVAKRKLLVEKQDQPVVLNICQQSMYEGEMNNQPYV